MPVVPRYPVPQVAVRPLPPVFRRQPGGELGAAYGEELGRSAQFTGALVLRRAQQIAEEDDANAAMEAYLKVSEKLRSYLHDPDTGVYAQRGRRALGSYQATEEQLGELRREASQGLTNDRQRNAFTALWNRRQEASLDGVARHVARERQTYKDATTAAMVQDAIDNAANAYTDPSAIRQSLAAGTAAIRANGQGDPPELTQQKLEAFRSTLHKGVIDRMLVADAAGAQVYYDAHRGDIDGADHAEIERALQTASQRQRGAVLAARMYAEGEPLSAIETAVRGSDAPQEVKDEAIRRVRARRQVAEHDADMAERELIQGAWQIVEQTHSTDALTASMLRAAAGPRLDAMERRAAILRSGRDTEQDPQAWAEFRTRSPEQIVQTDVWGEFVNRFDRAHMERALEIQSAYRDALGRKEIKPELTQAISFSQRVLATARSAGIVSPTKGRTGWSKKEALRLDEFETEAARRVQLYEVTQLGGKRKASGEEIQQILDGMLLEKVRVERWGRDPEIPAGALLEDERGKAYVPFTEIPPDAAADLKTFLDQQQVPWNQHLVERLYAATILRDRELVREILAGAKR